MFSLIVAILAIALVALLAIATILYMRNSTAEGVAAAQGAKILQEGSQLVGALEMYKSDHYGEMPSGTSEEVKQTLIDQKYLKVWPDVGWEFEPNYLTRSDISEEVCQNINRKLGIEGTPSCSDPAFSNVKVCCTLDGEPPAGDEGEEV